MFFGTLSITPAFAAPSIIALGAGTTVRAVSGNGMAACGVNNAIAFRWTASGGLVSLGDLAGGLTQSDAYALSADGSVIVGVGAISSGRQAFRWTSAGGMAAVPLLEGTPLLVLTPPEGSTGPPGTYQLPPAGVGYGVSGDGSIVVGSSTSTNSYGQAFRWQSPTTSALGGIGGDPLSSTAYAVSADGSTIVGQGTNNSSSIQAFVKTGSGPLMSLGGLSGGTPASTASAVSANGSVVAGRGTIVVNGENQPRGFRWTQAGGMQTLDTVAGGNGSTAAAINGSGTLLVGSATQLTGTPPNTATLTMAVIWNNSPTPQPIATLATAAGLDLTGWVLQSATGISSDGDVIVGNGTKNGVAQGWIIRGATAFFPAPAAPLVTLLTTGGQATVRFTAQAGYAYQVQRSTDLVTWSNLGTEYPATGTGSHDVADPASNPTAGSPPKVFYRVKFRSSP